jgi:hypothetical protein
MHDPANGLRRILLSRHYCGQASGRRLAVRFFADSSLFVFIRDKDRPGNQVRISFPSLQWRMLPPAHEHKRYPRPVDEQRQQSGRRNGH